MTNIFIENTYHPSRQDAYGSMFLNMGITPVADMDEADMLCFTGGADVSPTLYGRHKHPSAHISPERDDYCQFLWKSFRGANKPIVGICRGAQFVHVMNGHELVQDCDNHAAMGGHNARTSWMPGEVKVSSTHHQMMWLTDKQVEDSVAGDNGVEILLSTASLCTYKRTMSYEHRSVKVVAIEQGIDIESCAYRNTNSVSFQPHPEFAVHNDDFAECAKAFNFILNNYLEIN